MASKLNLALIFGGRSGEHEVSLMSAGSVLANLDTGKYNVIQVGITRQGKWLTGLNTLESFKRNDISSLKPVVFLPEPGDSVLYVNDKGHLQPYSRLDVVFLVLHGTYCEDGTLQGFLEMADVAYVGAGVTGSAVGMDKGVFKHVMQAIGIPVLPFTVINRDQILTNLAGSITQAESVSPYPLFTKPANLGSSVGILKCRNRSELQEGLLEAARFDRRVLVEQGISAREIEISVLGSEEPVASIPGEVIPKDIFYTYEDKYIHGVAELLIPAPLTVERVSQIQEIACKAFKAIDCAGMARADFFIDKATGNLYLNELNTIPGFTQISMYPKLWEASGMSYAELVDRLIDLAFQRKAQRDETIREYKS
jgi:D-alanine-D-alanine ligase